MLSDGSAYAVGIEGAVYERDSTGVWSPVNAPATELGHHAVYVDPDGGAWVVGGDLVALTDGALIYEGPSTPAGFISF